MLRWPSCTRNEATRAFSLIRTRLRSRLSLEDKANRLGVRARHDAGGVSVVGDVTARHPPHDSGDVVSCWTELERKGPVRLLSRRSFSRDASQITGVNTAFWRLTWCRMRGWTPLPSCTCITKVGWHVPVFWKLSDNCHNSGQFSFPFLFFFFFFLALISPKIDIHLVNDTLNYTVPGQWQDDYECWMWKEVGEGCPRIWLEGLRKIKKASDRLPVRDTNPGFPNTKQEW